jgi:anti-sigma regulatory factor (Ser/Thr protein kinase)
MRELSLHILDIIENSIEAGASLIELNIEENLRDNLLVIEIKDNGRGMTEEELLKANDPFVTTRTTREVGLGIALFKEAAERCNGELRLSSRPGKGTILRTVFQYDHLDRAPLGDIVSTLVGLIAVNPGLDFYYRHLYLIKDEKREFVFNTAEIKQELEGIEINNSQILNWIEGYLKEGLKDLWR